MRRLFSALGVFLVLGFTVFGSALADDPTPEPPHDWRSKEAVVPALPVPPHGGGVAGPQIVGGSLADPGEYPWQVALVYSADLDSDFEDPFEGFFCGGVLLDPTHVLTAAHCITFDFGLYVHPVWIDVVLGVNTLSDGPTAGVSGQRIGVDGVFAHAAHNPDTFDSDLALVRLESPATLDANTDVISYTHLFDSDLFDPGTMATVTGWGQTSVSDPASDDLREANVDIVSNTTCNGPSAYNGLVTPNMLCAGPAGGWRVG